MSTYTRHPLHNKIFIGDNGLVFNTRSGKLTTGQNSGIGYRELRCDGVKTYLHREVALMYVPNPKNESIINHKNGDRADNRAENLEWVSNRENILHGLHVLGKWPKKSFESPSCKLTRHQVEQIRNTKESSYKLAPKYGVSASTIRDIRRGRTHV